MPAPWSCFLVNFLSCGFTKWCPNNSISKIFLFVCLLVFLSSPFNCIQRTGLWHFSDWILALNGCSLLGICRFMSQMCVPSHPSLPLPCSVSRVPCCPRPATRVWVQCQSCRANPVLISELWLAVLVKSDILLCRMVGLGSSNIKGYVNIPPLWRSPGFMWSCSLKYMNFKQYR